MGAQTPPAGAGIQITDKYFRIGFYTWFVVAAILLLLLILMGPCDTPEGSKAKLYGLFGMNDLPCQNYDGDPLPIYKWDDDCVVVRIKDKLAYLSEGCKCGDPHKVIALADVENICDTIDDCDLCTKRRKKKTTKKPDPRPKVTCKSKHPTWSCLDRRYNTPLPGKSEAGLCPGKYTLCMLPGKPPVDPPDNPKPPGCKVRTYRLGKLVGQMDSSGFAVDKRNRVISPAASCSGISCTFAPTRVVKVRYCSPMEAVNFIKAKKQKAGNHAAEHNKAKVVGTENKTELNFSVEIDGVEKSIDDTVKKDGFYYIKDNDHPVEVEGKKKSSGGYGPSSVGRDKPDTTPRKASPPKPDSGHSGKAPEWNPDSSTTNTTNTSSNGGYGPGAVSSKKKSTPSPKKKSAGKSTNKSGKKTSSGGYGPSSVKK